MASLKDDYFRPMADNKAFINRRRPEARVQRTNTPVGAAKSIVWRSYRVCCRISLLLLTRRTSLKESLSHLSVALPGTQVLPDGPFAQPIEMRVHSWNPSFIRYRQCCGAL